MGIRGNNESMVTGKVRKGMGKSKYPRKHGQTKDAHADMYMLHDIWIYAGNIYSYTLICTEGEFSLLVCPLLFFPVLST